MLSIDDVYLSYSSHLSSLAASSLHSNYVTSRVDTTGITIVRRYARADELGIPFAITVDLETPTDGCVTLRERDSCRQVRGPIEEIARTVSLLCDRRLSWEDVVSRFSGLTFSLSFHFLGKTSHRLYLRRGGSEGFRDGWQAVDTTYVPAFPPNYIIAPDFSTKSMRAFIPLCVYVCERKKV